MPNSTVPSEKFAELQKAFPELFPYFFDAKGDLNAFGNMAQELLAKRALIEGATFIFDPENEVLRCCVASIPVSEEAHTSALLQLAESFLELQGFSEVPINLIS